MISPDFDLSYADFLTAGPVAWRMPSYMALMLPLVEACSMAVLNWLDPVIVGTFSGCFFAFTSSFPQGVQVFAVWVFLPLYKSLSINCCRLHDCEVCFIPVNTASHLPPIRLSSRLVDDRTKLVPSFLLFHSGRQDSGCSEMK